MKIYVYNKKVDIFIKRYLRNRLISAIVEPFGLKSFCPTNCTNIKGYVLEEDIL